MKTIQMGLNQEPDWVKADEVIERWRKSGNTKMIETWEKMKSESLKLRDEIIATVEADGACELNWSCSGETRFTMHSMQWARAMPEYRFEVGRYSCKVYKR